MLHITNGENAAQGIRDAELPGEILCWNDVLHEGPVPGGVDDFTFEDIRARFIASCGWNRYEAVRTELSRRDARLLAARNEDEVILWFEHDLYDQLQLIEVLARLGPRSRRPPRVVQIAGDQYLGTLPAGWFRAEFPNRTLVSEAAWAEANLAWNAFVFPDPTQLDGMRSSCRELPYLASALLRHLQEFPSVDTGLSRFERQLLNALADGPQDLLAAYHASHHDCEDAEFLADAVFAWHVSRLSQGEGALVRRLDGLPVDLPSDVSPAYWEQRIVVTPLAERILAGDVDRIAAAGIDRWLGGVHLQGHGVGWRWNDQQHQIVPSRDLPGT